MEQTDTDGLLRIYVGEGDPVADRLISHYKLKDFWSAAVFFIDNGQDDRLNKAHVQYLEATLVGRAREAKRCVLENSNVPQRPSLSEMDIADMEVFLEQMLLICGVLGISVFQKPLGVDPTTRIFYTNGKDLPASGYEVNDGFVVQAESQSPKDPAPSTPESVLKLRQTLLSQGVLVEDNGRYRLAQDYTFSSPSLAASVLLGRSANGRDEWKDA